MLVSAYLIGPAPAATTPSVARDTAQQPAVAKAPPPAPTATIKTVRAPVPLLTGGHDTYFDVSTAAAADTTVPAPQEARATQNDVTASDAAARASVERDGYRNIRGLVKAADGTWRGRAMRGSTEITVVVDPSGSVSAE